MKVRDTRIIALPKETPIISLGGDYTIEVAAGATPTKAEFDAVVHQVGILTDYCKALEQALITRGII